MNCKDRIEAMDAINAGLDNGKYDAMLNDEGQVRQLLFGIAAQILDETPAVQMKAVEITPNLLGECFVKCGVVTIEVVYDHLPQIMDSLFCILDRPEVDGNFEKVKFGVDELIDNVIATQHPGTHCTECSRYRDPCTLSQCGRMMVFYVMDSGGTAVGQGVCGKM